MEVHRPGEVIHSQYEVVETRENDAQRIVYKGKRLSDGVDVLIECSLPCGEADPSCPGSPEERTQELLAEEGTSDFSIVDSFEIDERGGKRFYTVKVEDLPQLADYPDGPILKKPRSYPVRSTVYQFGPRHLEIDVPCRGFDGGFTLLEIFFSLIPFCIVSWLMYRLILATTSGSTTGLFVATGIIGLFWLYGFYTLFKKPQSLFGHTNIVITPDDFRIKRTLELTPQRRDSVNHPNEANRRLSVLDRVFCKQLSGKTSNLTDAAFFVWHGQHGTKSWLGLEHRGKKHWVQLHVLKGEIAWLVVGVCLVIRTVRDRQIPDDAMNTVWQNSRS